MVSVIVPYDPSANAQDHTELIERMKKIFIIANWKSNKTVIEAKEWLQTINNSQLTISNAEKEIIVCSSFTAFPILKSLIINPPGGEAGHKPDIKLGAQNISPFNEGAYTGEINGKQVKEFADYVIIGHSERRSNFGETNEIIEQKIMQAIKYNLIPIICISKTSQLNGKWKMENGKFIIAYEPLFAIGTGNPDTPESADRTAKDIKNILGETPVLYGGSITSKNIKEFTQMASIDGVLVGGASLYAQEFSAIIKNA